MAKYNGPKDRLSRREAYDLFGKGGKLTRLSVPPGIHGPKGVRKSSQYGQQLREKQKVKRMYGLMEKQFKNYAVKALKQKGNTGVTLLRLLESRLDNVLYRLGFAPTRSAARQIVGHGHVLVNGKKVSIPSYQVKVSDTVTLTPKGLEIPYIKARLNEEAKLPSWLERKAVVGKMSKLPLREDIMEPIDEADIVEFYSR